MNYLFRTNLSDTERLIHDSTYTLWQTAAKAWLWLLGGLGVLSYVSMLKVAAMAINFGAFVLLADVYYALSRRVLRDEYLAYKVTKYFIPELHFHFIP